MLQSTFFTYKHSFIFHSSFFIALSIVRVQGGRIGYSPPSENKSNRIDLIEKILTTLSVPAMLAPVIYSFKKALMDENVECSSSSKSENPVWKLLLGASLSFFGFSLLHKSHSDLGGNWNVSLAIKKNHKLVTNGMYKKIRHPMYLGMMLIGVGFTFSLPKTSAAGSKKIFNVVDQSTLIGSLYLQSVLSLILSRIGKEEKMMIEEFGEEYREYQKRSWKLIPFMF